MVDDLDDVAREHVLRALEGLNRRAGHDLARLRRHVGGMRGSHGRILDLLADDGSRPSSLVQGAWITKQAVGARIRELEAMGWVSVTTDPTDGRALVVRRTAEGDRVRAAVRTAIAAMEREWAAAVGEARYATFREVIDELAGDIAADRG